jgi:hypothetical protein
LKALEARAAKVAAQIDDRRCEADALADEASEAYTRGEYDRWLALTCAATGLRRGPQPEMTDAEVEQGYRDFRELLGFDRDQVDQLVAGISATMRREGLS